VTQERAGSLNVAVAGDRGAPPLVLVHGLGGSWRSWGRVIEGLAARFRVLAVDLPGFGRSPEEPGGGFELDSVAGRIGDALDHLRVGEHVLVGHSMGGGVAIAYALRFGARVRRLVLVSPAGLIATGAVRPAWRRPRLHRVGREATRIAEPFLLLSSRARGAAFGRLVADPSALARRDALALVRGSRQGRGTPAAGISIVHAGLRSRLGELTMPTLVIWGEQDQVVSARYAAALGRELPDGSVVTLPGTGHLPQIERPTEVVAAIEGFAG
jgi:pimeloyl-ACP methyl ester carboxylesterase